MSGWGRDYDDDPALSLSDIERGLEGEDRATFAALLMKGMAAIEEGGLVQDLRTKLEAANRYASTQRDRADALQKALTEAHTAAQSLERYALEAAEALSATDGDKARALIADNKQLRERVEIQRRIIGRFEQSRAASPWQMFKDGLSSVFADPLTAVANAKAD